MKTNYFICNLLVFFLISAIVLRAQPENDPFVFQPSPVHLGNITDEDIVTIQFDLIYVGSGYKEYYLDIGPLQFFYPWITSVTPDEPFGLSYYGDGLTVTLSGQFEEPNDYGYNIMWVDFRENEWPNDFAQAQQVTYTSFDNIGIEDWIDFYEWEDSFSELDMVNYITIFHDEEPFGDYITSWNFKIKLLTTSNEEFIYVDLNDGAYNIAGWQFTAPELPANLNFKRNELGQVEGVIYVSAIDNDLVTHHAEMLVGINKEPDKPVIHTIPETNNTVQLFLNNSGGTTNYIYYDIDPGEPYNGTGLTQGDSPINIGNSTSFELNGLQECTKYYFAAKASNNFGLSDYSDEKSFYIVNAPNLLPVRYHFEDSFFDVDFTFEDNHYFTDDLIIGSGATVTMIGGFMYFEEDSKIIIEQGGKLILDGTTCTAPCGQTWAGIEVWGTKNRSQYLEDGQYWQGTLEMKNDAVIEYAKSAIELWKPGDYNTTGGIVKANNSTFRNNAKSVHAIKYDNYNPNMIGDPIMNNVSYFKYCTFEITNEYIPFVDLDFYKHADLNKVKGIDFIACDFTVVEVEGVNTWNQAIASYSAGFNVKAICNNTHVPCDDWVNALLTGFSGAFMRLMTVQIHTLCM